jgi:hypothetical protein
VTGVGTRPFVGVRLEGGLGDHVLGMRVLRFVRDGYPAHDLVVFSDSHGLPAQRQICEMCPLISSVVPIFHPAAPEVVPNTERIETARPEDRALMSRADLLVDAFGAEMFVTASKVLGIPIFGILAERPRLIARAEACRHAERVLAGRLDAPVALIGLHFAKMGPDRLGRNMKRLTYIVRRLLQVPHVVILNMFTSSYDYIHWPGSERTSRLARTREEAAMLYELSALSDRVLPCVDLPLATIVALLTRCRYFFGLDNGIKHIAWALGIPRTYFVEGDEPEVSRVLRWMPDVDRMLLVDCPDDRIESRIDEALVVVGDR